MLIVVSNLVNMGKGMDICVEYTGRYTSVSGDILKTTSSKEREFQPA
jgi:hypothetical protein